MWSTESPIDAGRCAQKCTSFLPLTKSLGQDPRGPNRFLGGPTRDRSCRKQAWTNAGNPKATSNAGGPPLSGGEGKRRPDGPTAVNSSRGLGSRGWHVVKAREGAGGGAAPNASGDGLARKLLEPLWRGCSN